MTVTTKYAVVSAKSGFGKTTMVCQLATHFAKRKEVAG